MTHSIVAMFSIHVAHIIRLIHIPGIAHSITHHSVTIISAAPLIGCLSITKLVIIMMKAV